MLQNPLLIQELKKHTCSIPSRKDILAHLTKQDKPIRKEDLEQELEIFGKEQLGGFHQLLHAMEKDGELILIQQQYYTLPDYVNRIYGTIIGHREHFGFLRVLGDKDDYYLSAEQMKLAIHGDLVMAEPHNQDRKGRREARILQVLVPNSSHIVGRFFIDANNIFVVPDDSRLNFNIFIPKEETRGAGVGFIVVVELMQRPTRQNKAIGKVVEVLGDNMSTSIAVNIALRNHAIPYIWSPEVKEQLAHLQEENKVAIIIKDKCERVDIRMLPLMTIDDEDARDLDDAVYCEKEPSGGWHLWVAIADVSYYVRPDTPLDQDAIRRTTSVYFPSEVVPMLPELLSNNLCSLNPNVDKLCLVCEMIVSTQGELSSYKFYEAIMHSHARLTYNEVFNILEKRQQGHIQHASIISSIKQLHEMYKTLEKAKIQRGGISFNTEETKFVFNSEQRIAHIEPFKRNHAHKLIEECMILANISAARFVEKYKEPVLYRVHDRPTKENIASLKTVLAELSLNLGGGEKPEPKDYANMMTRIAVRSDYEMLHLMLLRSMKQANYDPDNRGHFGLALPAYAHFTSPIRRYPDLALHRTIKYILGKQNGQIHGRSTPSGGWHSEKKELFQLGQRCSLNERRADEATRDVEDWLKCDFMKNHVGKHFNGIITNVTNFGFFVRLDPFYIEGLVHVSSLKNDYFRYDNIKQRLIGNSKKIIYRLGEPVKVLVKSVHMEERRIHFSLISSIYQLKKKKFRNYCQPKTLKNTKRKTLYIHRNTKKIETLK
ncbi:ribonuclease R [secondary endosymbiont of Heteropsylla cubana]|uniref:Ribonuclease R n=1 Tax=secondary endosymbiont of Heteropsylla cubana TaxID=134287 RepID=J3YT20_9ENTR|nr:ribonuclease R [secondary endosymbiont of Heteropsylla cubana]AFP85533.1 ribonuclease R [secondary endosymbiont of Heteropsylla cubana]